MNCVGQIVTLFIHFIHEPFNNNGEAVKKDNEYEVKKKAKKRNLKVKTKI